MFKLKCVCWLHVEHLAHSEFQIMNNEIECAPNDAREHFAPQRFARNESKQKIGFEIYRIPYARHPKWRVISSFYHPSLLRSQV